MGIFSPVLCRDQAVIYGLSSLTQGSKSLVAGATPTSIAVGNHLFVSRNTGEGAEYLGKVTGKSGTTVSFQFPAQSTKNTGAETWWVFTPSVPFQASSTVGTGGTTTSEENGIETLETAGKELLHTRIREPRDYVEILIRDAIASDWAAYRNWMRSEINGGLYQFVCAYRDHDAGRIRCDTVKMRSPGAALQAQSKAFALRSWPIDLQVIQRDYFRPT